jgi:basic membrane protein A
MGRLGVGMAGLACLVLAAGCNGGGGAAPAGSGGGGFAAGMVTDKGGIGDLSFNWMGWEGLQRAQKDLGIEVSKIESHEDADYQPNLQRLAEKGCKLVFAVGFALEPAVKEVAPRYPNTHFVIIDSAEPKADNVTGVTFREEEGAFLAGALAGGMTGKGKLGFVGGMEIPLIKRFEAGFIAGARTTRPAVDVAAKYTNKWDDVALGKELALSLFDQGADVVMHASGRCGLGVIEAAKERGPGFWAIGVDADQDYLGTADPQNPAPPSRVLTSMLKRVDNVVASLCKEARDGTLKAGVREFGVSNDGVGISPLKFTRDEIPADLLKRVEDLRARIAAGEIKPPRSLDELAGWKAPK